MVMSSLEGTMAVKLYFSPLPQPLVKQEVGLLGSGQGEAVALDGTGSVPLTVNLASSSGGSSNYSPLSGGGNASISEITVTSQQGASDALGAIDSALAYVQAERSNSV